jgi:hypothetical protein
MAMTIRQRYKKLSHARRSMKRNNSLHLQKLFKMPDSALTNAAIKDAMNLVINPPIVIDTHLTRNFDNPLNNLTGWE